MLKPQCRQSNRMSMARTLNHALLLGHPICWELLASILITVKEYKKNKVKNGTDIFSTGLFLYNKTTIPIQTYIHTHTHTHTYIYIYIYIYIYKVKWFRYRSGVAQRVGRSIALPFHDRSTRRGWVVSSTPRPHFTPGRGPVPILQEAGWAPGPVWTGGKSRPQRDSIPDRPARKELHSGLTNI